MRATLVLLLVALGAAPHAHAGGDRAEQQRRDVAVLLAGVKRIAMPGVPGTLSVFGDDAFPVIAGESGGRPAPLVAAARFGRGRAVLFGHNYFGGALKEADTARLVENVAAWAAGKRKARIGVRAWKPLAAHLAQAGFEVESLDAAGWHERLARLDAVFVPLADVSEGEYGALRVRLKAGLGVVAGMPGWGWQQLNPRKTLAVDNMANRLLAPAGLVWGGEYLAKPKGGLLAVTGPAAVLTHAGHALDALVGQAEGRRTLTSPESALAVGTVTRAIRDVPPDDKLLLPRLGKLLKHAREPRFVPSARSPLKDTEGLGKLLLTLQLQRDALLPPENVRAHPAAAEFPGSVAKAAKRVTRKRTIDTAVPGWHSTGLYAAPGAVVTVRIARAAVAAGLELRLGAHKDRLWGKAVWRRAPEITVQRPLAQARSMHACAFGGLVYVVVPPRCALGALDVTIQGAVEAPRFVLGTTTLADWTSSIRGFPGPWAELETTKVIITVPSAHVRALDDPEALMTWWDRVLDGCADLASIPRTRARPERYVADEQISNGYMHAGYPIMTHLDAAPRFVDLARLSTQGDWGMFHEMGHNHQHGDWTFGGTTEVTCNLFSLYLMETLCSQGIGHDAMKPASIARNRAAYRKGGAQFGLWKSKPFTALIMYYEMKRAFGWDAYKKVFAEYRDLADYERPKGDDAKRDQWLVRMSRTAGRDLGPFFVSWGIPVSDQARAAVAGLPSWMPADAR